MKQDSPNILLILTDQHRLSAMGCYGQTVCQTPNLDRLATRGLRFETAYTCCPVCSPARASIMTGRYPHAHGITSNIHNLGCSVHELPDGPDLLSRRLLAEGYACGYTGKWHLGTDLEATAFGTRNTPSLPETVGFEGQNFPDHGDGGHAYPEYRRYLQENGWEHRVRKATDRPLAAPYCGIVEGPEESTVPYFLGEHTKSLLDRYAHGKQPFFIWHNFWGPHAPCFITEADYNLYRDLAIPPFPNFEWEAAARPGPHRVKRHPRAESLSWENWAESLRYYYGFASLIDRQIGRILDHLEQTGLADNTIIIFAADHGVTLGSHGGLVDKGWNHFEEIQRIPLIVCLPEAYSGDVRPAGSVIDEWASLVDIYPTILDYAGAAMHARGVHGRSLRPLLEGTSHERRDTVFVEFFGVNDLATTMITCRHQSFKYGWNCGGEDELYDLENDPHETVNRIAAADCQDILRAMRERMAAFMEETGYPPAAKQLFRNMYGNPP